MKSSREIVAELISGDIPERIPYIEMLVSGNIINALHPGMSYMEFCDAEHVDMIFVKRDSRTIWIDRENGIYSNEWGLVRKKGLEEVDDYIDGPIKNKVDLRNFRVPDPYDRAGFAKLKEAIENYGKSKIIAFHTKATFSHPWYLMGSLQNYLEALYADEDFIADINRITTEYFLIQTEMAIRLGADVIVLSDDYAYKDKMFISREKFIKHCLPAIIEISDLVHRNKRHLFFHSDGNIMEIMDLLIEAKIDFLHPIEPGAMDIFAVHEKYGKDMIICGNVDCAHSLTLGTEEEVVREVLRLVRNLGPGGNYIISSSNTIHSAVNPTNYRAMLAAIAKYGRYPIDARMIAGYLNGALHNSRD